MYPVETPQSAVLCSGKVPQVTPYLYHVQHEMFFQWPVTVQSKIAKMACD